MMIKNISYLFLVITLLLFSGCGTGYVMKDGKWHYKDWNESWGTHYEELKNVDSRTFVVIDDDLGKDKNGIWHKAVFVKADPETFEKISGPYYRDVNQVFFKGSGVSIVKGADRSTFQVLRGLYGMDISSAYYQDEIIDDADIDSFMPTSDHYAIDKRNVWYRGMLISRPQVFPKKTWRGVDRATFSDQGQGIARDKYGRIEYGRPVE